MRLWPSTWWVCDKSVTLRFPHWRPKGAGLRTGLGVERHNNHSKDGPPTSSDMVLGDVALLSLLGDVQSDRYRCVFGATRTENCTGGELAHHPDGSRGAQQGKWTRGISVMGNPRSVTVTMVSVYCYPTFHLIIHWATCIIELMAHLHCRTLTRILIPNAMATTYCTETVNIVQTLTWNLNQIQFPWSLLYPYLWQNPYTDWVPRSDNVNMP